METKTRAAGAVSGHRNEILLVGELAAAPQVRALPSGDEVVAFRLTIRSEAAVPRGPGVGRKRDAGPHSDSIDCAVWRAELRSRLLRAQIGDQLEVSGLLRHRYWRGAAGLASRYEVEVTRCKTLARAPRPVPDK